jgi:hypothetical protein
MRDPAKITGTGHERVQLTGDGIRVVLKISVPDEFTDNHEHKDIPNIAEEAS